MTDILGLLAAGLVLATFSVTQMRVLRCLAIASNLAFIAYGVALDLVPIWTLHALLLPVNIHHLIRSLRVADGLTGFQRTKFAKHNQTTESVLH